ncbi:uncharacterized protein LOC132261768 isoform X2 [Phlebotomus argentipes]|uniref:uncharacterized protein LOC132261768 isoform X2 n=1 Tax=Phlebotomus argentipes TaxID=94469 RepID=UPI00289307E7|nr:uncharacterized protein LOC132261768 isoform X2 [Phlebotomus argentipes]
MINSSIIVGFVILCLAYCDAIALPNHYNMIQTYKSDPAPSSNGKPPLINVQNPGREDISHRGDFDDSAEARNIDLRQEEEIALKYAYLIQLLQEPTRDPLPVIYVESEQVADDDYHDDVMEKRSGRYYRRYPWKRQNNRYRTYDADSKYMCVPSREDVFRLLLGLHAVSVSGDEQKTVTFCSRKRPAKAVFTNIRFLG